MYPVSGTNERTLEEVDGQRAYTTSVSRMDPRQTEEGNFGVRIRSLRRLVGYSSSTVTLLARLGGRSTSATLSGRLIARW